MIQPILQLESVTRDFSDGRTIRRVLYKTDMSIFPGEFTIIAGPSGSGKTTLLTIMGLILKPTEGEVTIQNERVTHLSENRLATVRQQKYGFVFQQAELLPALNVIENVVVASGIQGQKVPADLRKKAAELLGGFGMGDCLSMTTQQLSVGQKQCVAIARALINAPALLLCDEPTSALDAESSTIVLDALKQLSKDTTRGLIMVTHDPRVFPYADRLIKIENGLIVYDSRSQGAQEA